MQPAPKTILQSDPDSFSRVILVYTQTSGADLCALRAAYRAASYSGVAEELDVPDLGFEAEPVVLFGSGEEFLFSSGVYGDFSTFCSTMFKLIKIIV